MLFSRDGELANQAESCGPGRVDLGCIARMGPDDVLRLGWRAGRGQTGLVGLKASKWVDGLAIGEVGSLGSSRSGEGLRSFELGFWEWVGRMFWRGERRDKGTRV